MPKYLIERKLPATRKKAIQELTAATGKTGPKLHWIHSYVTGDKCYCLYDAPNELAVRTFMRKGGLPVSRISKVVSIIDPTKLTIIDPTK